MKKSLISEEDKKVWQDFVQNVEKIENFCVKKEIKRPNILCRNMNDFHLKTRLDLHGFTIDEAYELLYSFLEINKSYGRKRIYIITGKGNNDKETLNKLVPRWLKEKPMNAFVASFEFLPFNTGELVINLKKTK